MKQRFSVGDLARLKYVRNGESDFWYAGAIVEIMEVCRRTTDDYDGFAYDYIVRMFNGGKAFPIDNQLEPLNKETVLRTTTFKLEEPV